MNLPIVLNSKTSKRDRALGCRQTSNNNNNKEQLRECQMKKIWFETGSAADNVVDDDDDDCRLIYLLFIHKRITR